MDVTSKEHVIFIVSTVEPCLPQKGFFLLAFGISLKVVFVFADFDKAELDFEMRLKFSSFSKIRPSFFKEALLKILMH